MNTGPMFPLVYEINTRIWLKKLSITYNRTVTLGNISDTELNFFSKCGFDIIWLMGVWKPSAYSKAIATSHQDLRSVFLDHLGSVTPDDITSSPYSIPSYTVNEALGGETELLSFRSKLHAIGIKLMLDFVPNHMGLDNAFLPEHPEYFIQVNHEERHQDPCSCFEYNKGHYLAYGKDPYFAPWTDTLQLNYAHPETHNMMTENLLKVSSLCDAIRCDMAMLILKNVFNMTWRNLAGSMDEEFWPNAISAVRRRHPKFLFLAESYWDKEWELQQMGFDFTYDKPFYDYISSVSVNIEKLTGHLLANWDYHKHLCRFIENHDEARAAEKIGLNNKAAAMVLMTVPGMHLIHEDQMDGFHKQIPVQLLRQALEPPNTDLNELYQKLFTLQKREIFQEGRIEWLDLNIASNSHCLGFHRFTAKENAYILANFASTGIALEFQHPSLSHIESKKLHVLSTSVPNKKNDLIFTGKSFRVNLDPHEAIAITCRDKILHPEL